MQKFEVAPRKIACLAVREITGSLRKAGGVQMNKLQGVVQRRVLLPMIKYRCS